MLRATRWTLRAIVWMLRAARWALRAIVWMLRAARWTLRAIVWMLRAARWTLRVIVLTVRAALGCQADKALVAVLVEQETMIVLAVSEVFYLSCLTQNDVLVQLELDVSAHGERAHVPVINYF
eukprot:5425513-Pyramimonas_sp.AAC.2